MSFRSYKSKPFWHCEVGRVTPCAPPPLSDFLLSSFVVILDFLRASLVDDDNDFGCGLAMNGQSNNVGTQLLPRTAASRHCALAPR